LLTPPRRAGLPSRQRRSRGGRPKSRPPEPRPLRLPCL
jgi:hypothetical protein